MISLLITTTCFHRAPVFSEDVGGEDGEGEVVKLPEKSFWAKYVSMPVDRSVSFHLSLLIIFPFF